jgi:hypothetical protein
MVTRGGLLDSAVAPTAAPAEPPPISVTPAGAPKTR